MMSDDDDSISRVPNVSTPSHTTTWPAAMRDSDDVDSESAPHNRQGLRHDTSDIKGLPSCNTDREASLSMANQGPLSGQSSIRSAAVEDIMAKALKLTPAILKACTDAVEVKESTRETTLRDYQSKFNRLTEKLGDPDIRPDIESWLLSLAPYHGAQNSFKAYRAALAHGLRQRMRELLAHQSNLQESSGYTPAWLNLVTRLNALLRILKAVNAAPYGADFWKSCGGKKRVGTRKGIDLRQLVKQHPNWKVEFLAAMSKTRYEDPAHVSALVGCRPVELRHGAVIRRFDEHNFSITILGAKVGKNSGQEWRTLTFANRVLPACWADRLTNDGQITVKINSAAAYRQSAKRISKRLFNAPDVTPYTFRHDFRTRQAEEGADEDEIGASMGHSSAESQFAYGSPPAKGKKRIKPTSRDLTAVQSARPVKPRDTTGLQNLLLKKRRKPKA